MLDPQEEARVRRALRQARRSARAEGRTWVLVYVLPPILLAGLPWPRPVTLLLACCFLALLIGAVPTWPYSRSWGVFPSGIVGVVLVIGALPLAAALAHNVVAALLLAAVLGLASDSGRS